MATEAEITAYLTASQALLDSVSAARAPMLTLSERVVKLRAVADAVENGPGPVRVAPQTGAEARVPDPGTKTAIAAALRALADRLIAEAAVPALP